MSDNSPPSRENVRKELRHALETMEFAAFERIMKSLLYKSGYLSVRLIGRNHKRGRTPKGGLDLTARSVTELSSSLAIAQVKQYKRVVSRRFVDELRGAMLRVGAEQGLLLTMSTFSKVAHRAAEESNVAPVKLIEGEEILDLLFAYRLGVVENKGTWKLDQKYLDNLQKRAMGTYRDSIVACVPDRKQAVSKAPLKPQRLSNRFTNHLSHKSRTYELSAYDSPIDDPQVIPLQSENPNEGGEMTWSTHLMAGLNTLWLLEALPVSQIENTALLAGAAAFGSLLPDLDASQSKIKHLKIGGIKPFYLPAEAIYHQLGHRSFLHSLAGLAYIGVVSTALAFFIGWPVALALALGYASHLAADAVTKSGIPLLYPKSKRFHLVPKGFRLTTGSLAEEAVFVLLSLSFMAFLLRHLAI